MRHILSLIGSLCLAVVLSWSPRAEACGGFFCSNVPIDQSGEEIIFDLRDGKVEAHVQISYVGTAEDFAWVVPVHGVPTVKIGAPAFFNYVRGVTRPQFNITWEESSCGGLYPPVYAASDGNSADAGTSAGGGVTVLAQGQVGPYDSVVLGATDGNALAQWLQTNGYNLQSPAALDPYVGQDFNFLALKLQQNRSVGELRPVVIEFGGARPCIPIRLTAVAAQPNMPITAYVFAGARAVPINYRHVLINETRIDWVNFGANYDQIASRAVDEAGGQAFLTEFAGATTPFRSPSQWQLPGPNLDTSALATKSHPVDFTEAFMAQGFPQGDGAIFALFQQYIPLPKALEGVVPPAQFYNQMSLYRDDIDNDPNRMAFDAAGFANALQTTIVEPLLNARDILAQQPYMTRLYTTMSAEEMTVDPEFEFNSGAPTVSNSHSAKGKVICGANDQPEFAEITLSDGRTYRVPWNQSGLGEGPYAARVEQYSESGGEPALITDNTALIDDVVERFMPQQPPGLGGAGCGCGASGLAPFAVGLIAALGLVDRSRRRRGAR